MAISTEDQSKVLKIVIGLFNGAPGTDFLPDLESYIESGNTHLGLARELAATDIFNNGVMGSATTSAEQAAILAGNFGLTADDVEGSAATQAIDFFQNGIDNGVNIGDLVYEAVEYLMQGDTLPEEFVEIATLLENKALTAAIYSANQGGTDLATLQSVLSAVTGDALYTEEDAIAALEAAGFPTPPDFTLTAESDTVSEGQPLTYTVTASKAVAVDTVVTFNVIIDDASAANQGTDSTNLNDFVAGTFNPVSVTIPAGGTTATFQVTAANDGVTELPENFSVTATVGGKTLSIDTLLLDGLVGEKFTLTEDSDIIDGTSGNDQIFGLGADTLSGADVIDGAAGTDTLTALFGTDGTRAPVIDNVEIIKIRIEDGAEVTLDLANSTGYNELWLDSDSDDDGQMAFSNINSANVKLGIGTVTDDAETYFSFDSGLLDGDNDAVTLEIKGATDTNEITIGGEDAGEGFEIVNLISSGNEVNDIEDFTIADEVDDNGNYTDFTITTLNISGSADLNMNFNGFLEDANGNSTGTVDASAFTGSFESFDMFNGNDVGDVLTFLSGSGDDFLELDDGGDVTVDGGDGDDEIIVGDGDDDVTGGAGDDDITTGAGDDTVDAGEGDDRVDVGSNLTEDDSIDGGDGIDTFATTSADAATIEADNALLAVISNFEVLGITDALADDIDLTTWGFDGGIELEVADASAGMITIANGGTITISDDAGTTGALVADVDGASDAGSNDDVLNVALAADYSGADNVTVDLSVDFVETVNLTVTDTDTDTAGTGTMQLDLSDDERVETINVTSDQTTIVTGTSFSALDTVDASDTTGDFTIDVSGASQGVVITSGSGDDEITGSDYADIISTGDGDDYIYGTTGADSLTGGDGEDVFDFSSADLSTTTEWTTIEDFAATATDADQITTVSGAAEADTGTTDVSAADDDVGTVTARITDGVIALGGLDKANIDTLDEWIAVAQIMLEVDAGVAGVLAFEFDGDTYVVDAGADDVIDNIIELTGVTGIDTVDTTAGADRKSVV